MDMWGGRRKLLAKNLMDVAKITVAAAFASEFFFKFPFYGKIAIYMFMLINVAISLFVYPKGED